MRPLASRSLRLALLVPLLPWGASVAHAAEPEKPWKVLYDRCQKLSTEGDYKGALVACEQAHALNPDPGILAYIAQIQTALLDPVQAREALSRYLQAGQLDDADRKTALAQVSYLDSVIGTLIVITPLVGAEIRVDGQALDESVLAKGARFTAGPHQVTLKAGGATFSRFVVLRGAERTRLELPGKGTLALSCAVPNTRFYVDGQEVDAALAARGLSLAAANHRVTFRGEKTSWPNQSVDVGPDERVTIVCTQPPLPPASAPRAPLNPRGYWITGIGLAIGVAALGTAIYNGQQYDKWQTANESLRDETLTFEQQHDIAQANNQLMNSIQTTRKVAVGLGVASGLVTAAGVVLLFADSSAPTRTGSSAWLRAVTSLRLGGGRDFGEVAWQGAW